MARDAAIELQYRAGIREVKDIAAEFKVTPGRVCQMAKEHGWTRDLTPKVRAKAQAKVDQATARDARAKAGEDGVVEAAAEQQASIIISERRGVARFLRMVDDLATELEAANAAAGQKKAEKDAPTPLPLVARIEALRKLSATKAGLIDLERRVYNIVDDTPIDASKRVEEAIDNGLAGLKAKFNAVLGK